ncbi:hypothetical protein ACFHW1_12170 [Micromonospora sp. LOL_014]|uniref:hypothetical protein n=1 Tax=Micromonospora sp. LOL_014 TaxID=3345415 RepID=UPI003A8A9AAE
MSSGSVGDVIAVLRKILDDLDGAAVAAKTTQKSSAAGARHYQTATEGADSSHATAARTQASEAAAKSGKIARLIAEAAAEISHYANRVAPGSVPTRTSATGGMPSGEALARPGHKKGSLAAKALGRVGQVRSSDDGLQHFGKLGGILQDAAKGSGGTAVSKTPDFSFRPTHQPSAPVGDGLLAALAVAIVGAKGVELMSRMRRRTRNDDTKEKG